MTAEPRYSCAAPGCPSEHASKWQVCQRPSKNETDSGIFAQYPEGTLFRTFDGKVHVRLPDSEVWDATSKATAPEIEEHAGSTPAPVLAEQGDASGRGTGGLTVPPSVSVYRTSNPLAKEVRRWAGPGAFGVFVPVRQSELLKIAEALERAAPETQPVASDQRADFERWLRDVHLLDATWDEPRNCYKEFPAHLAFQAWQAARAAPDVPDVCPRCQGSGTNHNPAYLHGSATCLLCKGTGRVQVPTSGECQHDLMKPDTTIEVIDPWKAKCKVCIQFFDLPGRPDSPRNER